MAMTHRTLFPPPDENRALEQLERLHREILRARRERERAGNEFDGFVQNFRASAPEGAPASAGEPAARRAPRAIVPATERPAVATEHARPAAVEKRDVAAPRAPEPRVAAPVTAPAPAEVAHSVSEPAVRRRSAPSLLIAAVVLLVGAVVAFYFWQRSLQPAAPQSSTSAAPSAPVAPAPAPTPRPVPPVTSNGQPATPPPPAVSPSAVQVMTDRAVWMRVTVDGQKVLEREVPAGETLTYTPKAVISIRAGDAGGVRVRVGGNPEQVLGRDAFPVTRQFEVPQPQSPR